MSSGSILIIVKEESEEKQEDGEARQWTTWKL